jgi:cell division protein FtsA
MSKIKTITGLDIGSGTVKILVAVPKNEESKFEVVASAQEISLGVRKGVVIDPEKASRIIQILLDKIRTENGQRINSVFASIGGSHIFLTSSKGMVAVSRADGKISEEDVDRVLQSAGTISLPSNKEILEIFPKEYIVDGEGEIKEAVGMQGGRLEAEVFVLAGFSPYKKNLAQAILDSDLQILDIIPSPLASSLSVLSQRQKELGVALLDIGAGTSQLAIFEEGNLIHLAVFPIGSANITNDIAIGLKTDIDTAELIKIEKGCCIFRGSDKKEKIDTGEELLVFSQKTLTRIIEARVSEIFREIQKELKKISKQGLLPAGIVLTGGGAKLPKIVELAKKELKLPCRIGKPSNFLGLEEDPSWATACGLVLKGVEEGERGIWAGEKWSGGNLGERVKKIFRIFLP